MAMASLSSRAAGSAAAARAVEKRAAASFPNGVFPTPSAPRGDATTQKSPFSSTTGGGAGAGPDGGDDHFGVWPPNQTTVVFRRMEEACPDVLTAYAKCVVHKQNCGALVQGACDDQFRAVMDCFRSVR